MPSQGKASSAIKIGLLSSRNLTLATRQRDQECWRIWLIVGKIKYSLARISMNALDKLSNIIDQKDEKIAELEEKIDRLEWWADKHNYFRPRIIEEPQELPVPRLQLELIVHNDYEHEWKYFLVYEHFTDQVTAIPMGQTFSRGGHKNDCYNTVEDVMRASPFRLGQDVRWDSKHLNLPVYAIVPTGAFLLPVIDKT